MSQSDMRRYGRRRSKSAIVNEIKRLEQRIQRIQAQPDLSEQKENRLAKLRARKQGVQWVLQR